MQDHGLEIVANRWTGSPGRRLDRFAVERSLGAGGMGAVYLAFDRRLGRRVALKVPHAGTGPLRWPERARILREAQALAQVRSAYVVELLDVHLDADLACLVMRPIGGASLRGRRLAWRPALALGVQIGAALVAVHRAGLVHRDVSPDNILVDADGRAVLIDFGLARRAGGRSEADDDLLALDLSPRGAGTRAFRAPEQRPGAAPEPTADQYGLCATIRALIAGDARELDVKAPPALARALRAGLSEAPDRRFTDMTALLQALRSIGTE
jgi:serine/threonine protein kinase